MPDSFYSGLRPEIGAFILGFTAVRQEMQDRAERIQWEEAQPQLEAQLQQLAQPMAQAMQAIQDAGNDSDARATASGKYQQAATAYMQQSMNLAARLGSSSNRYARQYAGNIQASTGELMKFELAMGSQREQEHANLIQEQQRREQMGFAQQQADREYATQQQKLGLETRQLDLQQQNQQMQRNQQQQEIDLRRQGLQQENALKTRELDIEQQKANRGPLTDPVERARAAVAIAQGKAEGAIGEKQADQLFDQLGIPREQREPELWDAKLEKDRKVYERALENTTDPQLRKRIQARLQAIQVESDAGLKSKLDADEKGSRSFFDTLSELGVSFAPGPGGMGPRGEPGATGAIGGKALGGY